MPEEKFNVFLWQQQAVQPVARIQKKNVALVVCVLIDFVMSELVYLLVVVQILEVCKILILFCLLCLGGAVLSAAVHRGSLELPTGCIKHWTSEGNTSSVVFMLYIF